MPSEIEAVVELCRQRQSDGTLDIAARRVFFDQRVELGTAPSDVSIEAVSADGVPAELVCAPGADAERIMLYLHGGGYCWGSLDSHRPLVAALSRAAAMAVLIIDYRRAPEHPYPAALDDAVTAYRWLRGTYAAGKRVAIAGDSAGGGLTLATLMAIRDAGDALPEAALAISPWTDLTCTAESYRTRADVDPICSHDMIDQLSRLYRGDADATDPYLSPLHGSFVGLPPLLIHVGEAEVLYDDSANAVARAKAHGVDAHLEAVADMVHVWHLFAPMLQEGRDAIDRAGKFLSGRLDR